MAVEPCLIHAYWEVTPGDFEASAKLADPDNRSAPWFLRFYDVTGLGDDCANARSHFDVTVDLAPGSWYVHLWEGEKTYFAEIGPRTPDDRLIPVCRSNLVFVPRAGPSPRYEPQWLRVSPEYGRVELVAEPGSPAGAAQAREPDAQPLPEPQGPAAPVTAPASVPVAESPALHPPAGPASLQPLPDSWTPEDFGGWAFPPAEAATVDLPIASFPGDEVASKMGSGGSVFPLGRSSRAPRESTVAPASPGAASAESESSWVEGDDSGRVILRTRLPDETREKSTPGASPADEPAVHRGGK